MNFQKDPRLAKRLAKEQAHLRKVARKNPERLDGHELSLVDWDLHLENYEERAPEPEHSHDHAE
jgi:hypothetical protein